MSIHKNALPIVTNGLVLYLDAANPRSYPGSGTTWKDLSGQGNSGTLVSGVSLVTNGSASYMNFNSATSTYVNLGTILNYTSENFTFSYWVNLSSLATNQLNAGQAQGAIMLYKGAYKVRGYYDAVEVADGTLSFITNQSNATQSTYTRPGAIAINTWYNICYVRSGSSVRIYINGIDATYTAGTHPNPATSTDSFRIGSYSNTYFMNGKMGVFMNYNRALSATEVLQNYNAQARRYQ